MLSDVRDIVNEVADRFGIELGLILSRRRTDIVLGARWEVIRLLSKTGRSQAQIGRLIGRDHTTIRYALRRQAWRPRWRRPRIRLVVGRYRKFLLNEVPGGSVAMIGRYRIYPAWFTRSEFGLAGATAPMNELAQREARLLGRAVKAVDIVTVGEDQRGSFIDFNVTYSSSERLEKLS